MIFGEVFEGIDVLDEIEAAQTLSKDQLGYVANLVLW